jgi:hypothetical protein
MKSENNPLEVFMDGWIDVVNVVVSGLSSPEVFI